MRQKLYLRLVAALGLALSAGCGGTDVTGNGTSAPESSVEEDVPSRSLEDAAIDATVPDATRAPLNLSTERALSQDAKQGDIELGEETARLPDLFGETEEKRIKTKSKLLMREESTGVRDAVEGVEFSIEMKTQ